MTEEDKRAPDEAQVGALVRFDNDLMRPAERRYVEGGEGPPSTPGQLYSLAELIGGCAWVTLGASLQAFPLREAALLLRRRFATAQLYIDHFLSQWGYLFGERIYRDLTSGAYIDFTPPDENASRFHSPEKLRGTFQSAVLSECRFARHDDARRFLSGLSFHLPGLERRRAGTLPDIEAILGASKSILDTGFLRTVEHMSELGFLFEHLQSEKSIEFDDRQMLQRSIREAVGWRFRSTGSRGIFMALCESVEAGLPWPVREGFDAASFRDELGKLMAEWGVGGGGTAEGGVGGGGPKGGGGTKVRTAGGSAR